MPVIFKNWFIKLKWILTTRCNKFELDKIKWKLNIEILREKMQLMSIGEMKQ